MEEPPNVVEYVDMQTHALDETLSAMLCSEQAMICCLCG